MTGFYFVRHGETVWHGENRYTGTSDVELTELGREQALELAGWAKTAELAACWSSSLSRARETLAPTAEATGLVARYDPRLSEIDFGTGEGRTSAEMGPEFQAFERDPVASHLPGGEDPVAAAARAINCLTEIAAEFPDGRVLVVWHSTIMRLVLCDLLGIPLADYRRVFPIVHNVALTEVRFVKGTHSLLRFNAPARPAD